MRHCKRGCFKQSNSNKNEHQHVLRITNNFESWLYNTDDACSPQWRTPRPSTWRGRVARPPSLCSRAGTRGSRSQNHRSWYGRPYPAGSSWNIVHQSRVWLSATDLHKPQSTYLYKRWNRVSVSAHSAGAYTATLLVMVNVIKGGGRAPPTLTSPD